MGPGTLARRLVLRVASLVALVAVLLSTATALGTWQLLTHQVDGQLDTVISRLRRDGSGPGGGPSRGLVQPGQPIGTVYAAFTSSGATVESGKLVERRRTDIEDQVVADLSAVPITGRPQTVSLAGLGRYRVAGYNAKILTAGQQIDGTLVVGVPLSDVDGLMGALIGLEIVLSIIAIGVTVAVARALVHRSLRPLNRVATTAQQVSQLKLDRGEVALAVRVPPEDTDPRSEVGQVGLAINHMLNNVESALAARQASEMKVRQFVADASHELRNPLAAIRGYAELTRRSGEAVPPDAAYAISRVESEAGRMSHLVEDLLLLARLDAGPALDIRPTDLTELMIHAVSDARAAGPEHAWSLDLPDEPVTAPADRHRLYQVVANLLANARSHTPPGTQVRAGLRLDRDAAVIQVTDNGPGIPAELQPQVFERFTRAEVSRVRTAGAAPGGSTGLGLAIVAAVVDAHRGTVTVDSEPGRTRFSVRLPLTDGPAADRTPTHQTDP